VAYANEGRHEEALQSYLQALSLRPDLAIAHYHLGNLYREQGKKV
jgi:tetratricopeptide (TPR) repeat protein